MTGTYGKTNGVTMTKKTELTPEQQETVDKIAEREVSAILDMAVLAVMTHPKSTYNNGVADAEETNEAIKTMLLQLGEEEAEFKNILVTQGHKLVMREVKALRLKPFQWDTKEQLMKPQEKEFREWGDYLHNRLMQYIKFPDKTVRDKIRRAVEMNRGYPNSHQTS